MLHYFQVKFAVLQNVSVMPRLRYLDVKFCSPTGREHEAAGSLAVHRLAEHLPRLHQLVSLDVSWVCTASMLRIIAAHCPRLQRLVAQDSRLERGDARLLCALSELRWLNVDSHHEPVTPADIAFLLQRLPQLVVLEYPDIEGVVATLKSNTSNHSFVIRDFSSALYRANTQLLADLNILFPKIETLRLYKPTGELSVLTQLKHLKVLTVNECVPQMLSTFLQDMEGELQDITLHSLSSLSDLFTSRSVGLSRLKSIKLLGCQGIDLLLLNQCCPNLEELKLSQCVATELSHSALLHTQSAFSRLGTLKVCGSFQAPHLLLLLSSCREVHRITVGAPATEDRIRHVLTDALWLDILRRNPMTRLEKLHLVSDRVSRRILDEMLLRLPSLSILYLTGHTWSRELAGDAIDRLKTFLRPLEIRLRIQGAGLYYFSYPEDS